MAIRDFIEDVMYGRRRQAPLRCCLLFFSFLYGAAVRLRNALYAVGLKRKKRLPVRVISVGNITLGGTGKTPAVIEIAELLILNGGRPAVVSRGYGRRDESELLVVSDGRDVHAGAVDAGDEPVLIASRVPRAVVVVGSDRYRAGLVATGSFGADTVILDDGFQHQRLRRDLNIVLIDSGLPFGNRSLLPAGILREPVSGLRRADAVLITGWDVRGDGLKAEIRSLTKAPIFTAQSEPLDITDIKTGEARPLVALKGTKIFAFSGIARPERFGGLLRSLGAVLREEVSYPDHYRYTRQDLADIFLKASDSKAVMIITTEKDAVRLRHLNPDGIWALRIRLKVREQEEWERMILDRGQKA